MMFNEITKGRGTKIFLGDEGGIKQNDISARTLLHLERMLLVQRFYRHMDVQVTATSCSDQILKKERVSEARTFAIKIPFRDAEESQKFEMKELCDPNRKSGTLNLTVLVAHLHNMTCK